MSSASSSFDGPNCTICFENVIEGGNRSIAKLHCGHIFHLDCIGSEFNFHRAMRCPNCRETENGQWLYAAGGYNRHDSEIITELVDEGEHYHILLPTGREWCPQLNGFRNSREQIRERLLIQRSYNIRNTQSQSQGSAVFHVVRVEPHHHLTEQAIVEPVVLTPLGPALVSSLGAGSNFGFGSGSDFGHEANRFWQQRTLPNSPLPSMQSLASRVDPMNNGVTMQPGEVPYLAQQAGGLPESPMYGRPGEAIQSQSARGQASGEVEMLIDEYNRHYFMHRFF